MNMIAKDSTDKTQWQCPTSLKKGELVVAELDSGKRRALFVKQPPWQLGDGEWVVGLSGISGGYLLSRIRGILPGGGLDSFLRQAIENKECHRCGEPLVDYEPEFCCSGSSTMECGCRGLPLNEPICDRCN